jgi:SAM-dependent methyltransferase
LERHRLFFLTFEQKCFNVGGGLFEPVVHFAAEAILEKTLRRNCKEYRTADLFNPADLKLNIEAIDIEDEMVGTVIANHVFEHVDDLKAATEIYRILKPGGKLIASVPIIEGWASSYENPSVTTDDERVLHFGQKDHIRFYGSDFRQRISRVGFRELAEFTAEGEDVIKYGLVRGEKIFVFTK